MVFKNISVCFVWRGGGLVVLEVVEVSVVVLDGGPFRLRRLRKPEIDENRFLQIFLSDRSIYLFFFGFRASSVDQIMSLDVDKVRGQSTGFATLLYRQVLV